MNYQFLFFDTEFPFMFILRELANNGLKNNDKTSDKISINQGKDTCKKQVCNKQLISRLQKRLRKGA